MSAVATWFQRGGMTMFWITFLLAPTVGLAGFHAIAPRRWSGIAGAAAVALVLACGAFGTYEGRKLTNEGIAAWSSDIGSPAERDEMRDEGYAEARLPIEYAAGVAAMAGLALAIGFARRRARTL